MGLKKFIKKTRNTVKKVASPVTRVTEKLLKPIAKPLRPLAAGVAPIAAPFGVGLVVQPKALGIRNAKSAKIFDRSQQITRIAAGAAAAVVGGPAVLSGAGKLVGSIAPMASSFLGGGGPTDDTAWGPEGGYSAAVEQGGYTLDPSEYGPSPAWPLRPEAGLPSQGPSNISPILAVAAIGVGVYLLAKGA